MEINFKSKLWEWQGEGAWCFVSVPTEYYEDIRQIGTKRGFGSIRVEAKIGNSVWKTSIFPDTKSNTYLLPVKKQIRTTEQIFVGSMVQVVITLIED